MPLVLIRSMQMQKLKTSEFVNLTQVIPMKMLRKKIEKSVLGFLKVFSHDTRGGLFSSQDNAGHKNPEMPYTAKLFSILDQLENFRENDGNFHLKLCYPELTWGIDGQTCNEWKQSSNPYTDSLITGFQPIFLAFTQDSYFNDWRGLGKSPSQFPQTLIDDAPEESFWSSAIGATEYFPEKPFILGPKHTEIDNMNVTKVELYVAKPFAKKPSGNYQQERCINSIFLKNGQNGKIGRSVHLAVMERLTLERGLVQNQECAGANINRHPLLCCPSGLPGQAVL